MSKEQTRETFERALSDASDPLNLQPEVAPAPAGHGAPAAHPGDGVRLPKEDDPDPASQTPYIDAYGFDPTDFRFVPVRVRPRKDGWTEAKQRLFIEQLADTACVEAAARAVDMSVQSAYALRRAPGGESFAAAWNAAIQQGALKLVDIAFDRAIHGSDEPVFNRDGRCVGRRMRQSERLLMFLLRAHLPQRYRHAHRDAVQPGETLPPAQGEPLAQALARLEPVVPPDPHRLVSPADFDNDVEVADACDGELPPWFNPRPRVYAPIAVSPGKELERRWAEAEAAPDPEEAMMKLLTEDLKRQEEGGLA